ncbi:hypothetical protein DB32_007601 [Sandaracinus amylolyticus]|uniref:Uncharacterized protein n=1 Tax=Sandaracinus amylolyticus TaxID=927083 RepID=A0A0F6W930_9BACT|nr:hypothetical protein DB32_007601 [Sandaracinus amylolyticus]
MGPCASLSLAGPPGPALVHPNQHHAPRPGAAHRGSRATSASRAPFLPARPLARQPGRAAARDFRGGDVAPRSASGGPSRQNVEAPDRWHGRGSMISRR